MENRSHLTCCGDATIAASGRHFLDVKGAELKKISNPPDAASLMMSARSFGNYDLAGALADLVDNSIKADARNVWILCKYNSGDPVVSVRDDGHGMSAGELKQAFLASALMLLSTRSARAPARS
ncbi:MAG: ATP-binding protein [Cyanobacteria bacterium J06555_12]